MKEPYREGPASHPGLESCAGGREAAREALTGEHAGAVLSPENVKPWGADAVPIAEGKTAGGARGKRPAGPTGSKTRRTRGNSSDGNREIPGAPKPSRGGTGRQEKVNDQTPCMNASGKSDDRIVLEKGANEGQGIPCLEESWEGRRSTKGNTGESAARQTQSWEDAKRGLERVREAAAKRKREGGGQFTALLHHVTPELLKRSYLKLKRKAAPGVDGMTWEQYGADLDERIRDLHERVHKEKYRAQPSKRTYIPKEDGRMRPLGIAAIEDKIVQQALMTVMNQIYEEEFEGFSYGFRPGRSQHDALDALWVGITTKRVNWVLDADIKGFFDHMDHEWLMKFVEHLIADRRVLALIRKWLTAGVSEDGEWSATTVGTPQGAVISPLLANVYLHYVLDLWVKKWRKEKGRGSAIMVRYADDFIVGFQYKGDAVAFLKELKERVEKFGLSLHPKKTRLIEFGRFARGNRRQRGEGKPETFDFLGFTHVCSTKVKDGKFIILRITMKKRLRATLKVIRERLKERMHRPIRETGAWLQRVIRGYDRYHAVPGNQAVLRRLRREIRRAWLWSLRRRGQKRPISWERFRRITKDWIPAPRVLHPYPPQRFYAKYPR